VTFLAALTMGEARRLVAAGQLDPAAVLAAGKGSDLWHCFTWRPAGDGPAAPAVPKDGSPLALFGGALKANICRHGWPADCGSRILAGYRSPFTATAVARLESVGASFLGVTAMDEFGMGSSCEYSAAGPALNPWDPARTPGGSSGGAAAAVAAGLAWFALGSDTGGSVRFPAHCCGLVGFKPAWGRVSRHGLVPFASSLDTIGVLARDVADAALVMQHMAGPDPRDATTLTGPPPVLTGTAGQSVRGMSMGVPWSLLDRDHEPGLREDFEDCLRDLAGLGVETREIDLPAAADAVAVYQVLASAEAASNLARYDGSLYGARAAAGSYQQTLTTTRTRGFGPEVQRRIIWGTHVLSEGYRDQLYLRARGRRGQLSGEFASVFGQVDAVILPTAPVAAFPLGSLVDDPPAMHEVDVYTVPASLAGLPAITLPTGLTRQGLPLGVQLVGPVGGEGKLVALAAALERERAFRDRKEAPWHRD